MARAQLTTGKDCLPLLTIDRHRTAIKRSTLSRPMNLLLNHNLVHSETKVFDFGCGRGGDIERLRSEFSIDAIGYDRFFAPEAPLVKSCVVNLGYVLNVIECPKERVKTLKDAFSISKKLLCVSVRTDGYELKNAKPFRDGFLSSRNTFQKFYKSSEIVGLLEDVLKKPVVSLSRETHLVFRYKKDANLFRAQLH